VDYRVTISESAEIPRAKELSAAYPHEAHDEEILMSSTQTWRHGALTLSVCATLALATGTATSVLAETLDELAAKAAEEGEIVWYEANSPEMGDKLVAAFNARFPDVGLRFERVAGAQGITTKIVQESEAGAATADVTTTGIDQVHGLYERGLIDSIEWGQYGVPEHLTPAPYAVATTAAIWVIVYNTNLVSEADAPKSWEDLGDEKWRGKLGIWAIGHAQANLAAEWGESRVTELMEKMVAQEPLLYKSNFTIAQNLAAGEISVGITPLHVALATQAKGAPLGIVAPEPTPMSMIYSGVVTGTPRPNGARLLVAWLSSESGALAYEEATERGNPFLEFTETAKYLQGRNLSTFDPDETGTLQELIAKYTEMLRGAGTAQ
jgi:iron(III) transport system substrate-binding protein